MLLRALTPLFAMGCLSSGEGKPFGSDSGAPILEDPNPTDDSGEPSDTGSDDAVDRLQPDGLADRHGLPHCVMPRSRRPTAVTEPQVRRATPTQWPM